MLSDRDCELTTYTIKAFSPVFDPLTTGLKSVWKTICVYSVVRFNGVYGFTITEKKYP